MKMLWATRDSKLESKWTEFSQGEAVKYEESVSENSVHQQNYMSDTYKCNRLSSEYNFWKSLISLAHKEGVFGFTRRRFGSSWQAFDLTKKMER